MNDAGFIEGRHNAFSLAEQVSDVVLKRRFGLAWKLGLLLSFSGFMLFNLALTWLLVKGVGIWGIQIPVAWGFAITNFVWWIGIGHAGTFISAILFLMNQKWRTSINRFAEAMTLFAVACAGLFPLLHLGRPWLFYWLIPYPSTTGVWPQFRSPLMWDFFAVGTYATVSLVFWYLGVVPDLAVMRDRAKRTWLRRLYGVFAIGWRGSTKQWKPYTRAYLLLAGLATPLVLSVHSVVAMDFTAALVPGWHTTILPPYFVAGAIYSGFAMVLTLAIPLRKAFHFEQFITKKHLDACAKLMFVNGLIVAYSYLIEKFSEWYLGSAADLNHLYADLKGPYALEFWLEILCNVVIPQALWSSKVRKNPFWLFVISLVINVGMWTERFVIIVGSLARDYMSSMWNLFEPTIWDWATYAGTLGIFFLLFLIFARIVPVISISELQELQHEEEVQAS
jgi:molybdopterin-containing oxidoreductase family membrane subunit